MDDGTAVFGRDGVERAVDDTFAPSDLSRMRRRCTPIDGDGNKEELMLFYLGLGLSSPWQKSKQAKRPTLHICKRLICVVEQAFSPAIARRRDFCHGLLGQRHDPTAIAVIERMDMARPLLRLRHLERLALGTPYPDVVARVREITSGSELLAGRCVLAVGGTAGVRDITSGTITSGEHQRQNGTSCSVPKRDLLAVLQVLLERNELKLAR